MRKTTFNRAGRSFLFLLSLLLGTLSAQATEYTYNGLYFDINVTTREATLINNGGYGTYSGTVDIPETFVGAKNLTYTVTAIGESAFRDCPYLTAVSIPTTVEEIGAYAFYGCTGLTELVLPNLLESIGAYAFYNCSGLTSMSLPPFVTVIRPYTFYGCSNLTSVTIPSNLTTIEGNAFRGCTKLPRVTLPQKLTTLGEQAFYNCTSLATVSMSNALTSIGSEAFRGCTSLTAITLPNVLTTIGSSAFYGTTSLQSVTIPASLTSLGSEAFSGSGVQALTYADGCTTALRTYATGLTSVTMASTITDIPEYAFYNCSQLSTAAIPSKVKSIGKFAFYGCSSLKKATIPAATTSIGENAFGNSGVTTLTYASKTKTALRTYATQLTKVTLPTSLKSISDNCFYGCSQLASITLPESLETIGSNAFYNCNTLTTLTIPASLTSIGSNAFSGTNIQTLVYAQGCTTALRTYATTLTSVSIPNTLAHFAPGVFQDCNSLENIHIADLEMWNYIFSQESSNPLPVAHRIYLNGNQLTALNADFGCGLSRYAFAQCLGLKQVNITNSVTSIEDYGFMQCPDLEAVAMGSGTERIGMNAFQGCTSLSAVRLGNGLKTIGKNAFNGCSELNSLLMGDNVQKIEESAFRGCYKLVKVQLPSTLTAIGASAFRDCYELQEIAIPAGVRIIPDHAFYDCRKLETLEIGEAVTSIGAYAFYGCKSLKILTVPNATKTIGDNAFANCETIRYAYLGTGVTNIGTYAFGNNQNLLGFYCLSVSVPSCSSNAFSDSEVEYITLYVPDESITAYESQSPWSSFGVKSGLSSAPVFVNSITLSSPVLVMEEGDIDNITATVAPQNATNKKVKWASSNQDVVKVTSKGNVLAEEEGVATITCTADDDNGATAKSLIIVSNNFKQTTEITLSSTSLTLPEGKETHLTATTAPANATYRDVIWTSSNPLIAQVSDVGYVTALSVGTATITCAAADGKGAEATCTVKVTEPVDPTIGDANEDGNVSVADLTYAVSVILQRIEQGEDISLYDMNGDGEITIEDVVSIAEIILGYDVEPAVRLLELSATELTVGISETTRLNYTVIPYKLNGSLTWTSSNENVLTVTDDGTITAVNAGTAVVTLSEPGGLTAECVVTVDGSYGSTDGHTWVDLGLPSGTHWATVNVGAQSQQEYGSYYAWGETQPKDSYTWGNYQHCSGSATTLTKYCTTPNKGTRDDKTVLEPADDAATAAWGSNWCMPSEDQFAELFDSRYTSTLWTEQNGLYGCLVTSRVNGNTLFLPAAGYMNGSTLSSGGSGGYYATLNLSANDCDYNRSFNFGEYDATLTDTYRSYGQSVRPVFSSSVAITPSSAMIDIGESITLKAVIRKNTGTESGHFTWTSSDTSIATVSSKGVVKGKAVGTVVIYATDDSGLCGSCFITVGQSFAVNLNGQWQPSTSYGSLEENSGEYVFYESFSNYNVNGGKASMLIDIVGYTEFTFKVRNYSESSYDYVVVNNLDDLSIPSWAPYVGNGLASSGYVYYKNNGKSSSTTWYDVTFSNLDGGHHRILVTYGKNGSSHYNSDRGYVAIQGVPAFMPDAPSNVSAVIDDNGTAIHVSWDAVTNAKSYKVYRSNSAEGMYEPVAVNVTTTSWTDANPSVGTNYYKVSAVANGHESALSRSARALAYNPYGEVVNVNGVSFRMVHVAGGTFQMGATSEQGSDYDSDERPVHSVTLSDYYIGETEVTQELWYAVMGQRPTSGGSQWSSSYGLGDDYPVYYVSWNDCQEFITRLNQLTGKSFRLPTEAEWEFAARGGNSSLGYKYAGSNTIGDVAWYTSNSSSKTHPVGTKSPNELGLYDMSGNVWEWCQDWYGSYGSTAQTDPTGPSSGSNRVRRGGSWVNDAGGCRVSNRSYDPPSGRYNGIGLRLAL